MCRPKSREKTHNFFTKMSTEQSIVVEKESSTLDLRLHPLVIINISDHFTRTRVQQTDPKPRVIGCIVGTQTGRVVEIFNSYEISWSKVDGNPVINPEFITTKQEQFKKVFPTYEILGWYSSGESILPSDLAVHKQISEFNEAPLFLLLDTVATARPDTKDLPITICESELRMVGDKATTVFAKVPYKVETGEAERISVDHVAKINPSGTSSGSQISVHLTGIHNSVSMLAIRLRILKKYLESVKNGSLPADHGLLRQIGSLCNQLPALDTPDLKHDFVSEYNDSLVVTYLASMTKGSNSLNEMIDKFNLVNEKAQKKRATAFHL
eukprot:TRINITY_DN13908_c0_g1_i1.p1 TRINITY_DN13908_c0_g1~~TRINITY_DN13908_c0_g1_i1.p1  ORF type:complete len:325 (-),score=105.54 TRINITY_DN13908_c0_g1_i1:43-1017(-)